MLKYGRFGTTTNNGLICAKFNDLTKGMHAINPNNTNDTSA